MYYFEMGNASQSKGFMNQLLKGGFPMKILEAKRYSSAPSCKGFYHAKQCEEVKDQKHSSPLYAETTKTRPSQKENVKNIMKYLKFSVSNPIVQGTGQALLPQ